MRFSMLYSGGQNLSFKSCLVFYAGDSLRNSYFKQYREYRKLVKYKRKHYTKILYQNWMNWNAMTLNLTGIL